MAPFVFLKVMHVDGMLAVACLTLACILYYFVSNMERTLGLCVIYKPISKAVEIVLLLIVGPLRCWVNFLEYVVAALVLTFAC
jgi:hypothetical protein